MFILQKQNPISSIFVYVWCHSTDKNLRYSVLKMIKCDLFAGFVVNSLPLHHGSMFVRLMSDSLALSLGLFSFQTPYREMGNSPGGDMKHRRLNEILCEHSKALFISTGSGEKAVEICLKPDAYSSSTGGGAHSGERSLLPKRENA